MLLERKSNISIKEFEDSYLSANKPVIITDAMNNWEIFKKWSSDYFCEHFGDQETQLYDDLFNCIGIVQLREYIRRYFGNNNKDTHETIPYIRWYTRLKDRDFVWADSFFDKIKDDWQLPYFLPNSNYLLPFCPPSKNVSPVCDNFPAKGIFISAKGAKTSLHFDPWCSDAVLCQVYGKKNIVMYSPDQKKYLYKEDKCINIEEPDLREFPHFLKSSPTFIDVLNPGEIVFFPHGWLHHVYTSSDSISLTWNFVHMSTWKAFFEYLVASNQPSDELEVIKFFLNFT